MSELKFPENPVEGDLHTVTDNKQYIFRAGKWNSYINALTDPERAYTEFDKVIGKPETYPASPHTHNGITMVASQW